MFQVIITWASIMSFEAKGRLLISLSFIFLIFWNWFTLYKNFSGSLTRALITIKGDISVVSIDWLWILTGAFSAYICTASAAVVSMLFKINLDLRTANIFIYIPCPIFIMYPNKIKIPSLKHYFCKLGHSIPKVESY